MMGIQNIRILIHEPVDKVTVTITPVQQAQVAALQEKRIAEHRAGLHTYGNMRRDCPMCQGR